LVVVAVVGCGGRERGVRLKLALCWLDRGCSPRLGVLQRVTAIVTAGSAILFSKYHHQPAKRKNLNFFFFKKK
jgi:hypothetical protein